MTEQYNSSHDAHGRMKHYLGFYYYIQGGLDCYCGPYSLANAINYLHWKDSEGKETDFLGRDNFEFFRNEFWKAIQKLDLGAFGGEGVYGDTLSKLSSKFLKLIKNKQNFKVDTNKEPHSFKEEYFIDSIRKYTCLVWIEEENDRSTQGHWICTTAEHDIIDSIRGMTRWEIEEHPELKDSKFWAIRDQPSLGNPLFKFGKHPVKHVHCVIALELQ